jgi:phosphoserine phosphatase RsbU/P
MDVLSTILVSRRAELTAIAQAWLDSGASSFSLWEHDRLLMAWPEGDRPYAADEVSRAPIPVGNHQTGELRVAYTSGATTQARLCADAAMIAALATLEDEVGAITAELVAKQDQLLALYDLVQLQHRTQSTETLINISQMLDAFAREIARLTGTRCACYLLRVAGGEPIVAQSPDAFLNLCSIQDCVQTLRNGDRDVLLNASDMPAGLRLIAGNLLLAPMRVRDVAMAAIILTTPPGTRFTSPDVKLARTIAKHVGAQVENALLYAELLEQTKLQTEMELATQVQVRLLPQLTPRVRGLDIAARSRPALQVGGDFYDLIERSGQPFIFSIGDATGKGMSAALIMAMCHTIIRSAAKFMPDPIPESILRRVNENLYADLTALDTLVTAFAGYYDPDRRELIYANAGHSPVIFKPVAGPARLLEADAPPIGVFPQCLAEDHRIALRPGDVLIAATDGFSEARNAAGEMYGYEEFTLLVENMAAATAEEIADVLFDTMDRFSSGHAQDDDQTLIVLKCTQE